MRSIVVRTLAPFAVAACQAGTVGAQQLNVSVPDTTALHGVNSAVEFVVGADPASHLLLQVTPLAGGITVTVDSAEAAPAPVRLRLVPVGGAHPRFPSGGYWVDVVAISPAGGRSRVRFSAVLETPAVELQDEPTGLDRSLLRPERRRTPLSLSIAAGVLATGATILASRVVRPHEITRAEESRSSRPIVIGVSLGALTAIGARILGGRPDPEAARHNAEMRDDYNRQSDLVRSTNAFLLDSYEGMVILRRVDS